MEKRSIPESLKKRVPLLKDEWIDLYTEMGGHPHSPKWNTECGDRLKAEDMLFVREYADGLTRVRDTFSQSPPGWLIKWAEEMRQRSEWFRASFTSGDIKDSWNRCRPMRRNDMQSSLETIVPYDADLARLVVNPTSGTTGNPIQAPNHPRGVGCYDPLIQYALERHGVKKTYGTGDVAAIQVCAQKKTITYHTVHSYHNGAGFAKINLHDESWKTPGSAEIYINDMKPVFLSGDPFSFLEYMRLGISYRPEALLTTALHLESSLREEMEKYFECPVIDMYSLNETGPVAYSCPSDPSRFHILPHDIFVEVLSPDNGPLPENTHGNIAVSGGRNPYLPLLRYLTGDSASISYEKCGCGEKSPFLCGLQGREMVLFRTPSGGIINSIDIAGIVRKYPVYIFQFMQTKDYNCRLSISAGSDLTQKKEENLKSELDSLFRNETETFIDRDFRPCDRKNIPFISEFKTGADTH